MAGLECPPGRRAPCDLSSGGPGTRRTFRRRVSVVCGRPRGGSAGGVGGNARCGAGSTAVAGGGPRRDRGEEKAERQGQISEHAA
jgi:hypothetical protein